MRSMLQHNTRLGTQTQIVIQNKCHEDINMGGLNCAYPVSQRSTLQSRLEYLVDVHEKKGPP